MRVAVVGARRSRDGLGPFVARDLAAAGARVAALVATTEASCAEAVDQVERFTGVRPCAHLDVEALLAAERLDALAICSPHETHAAILERALDAGLHVLCEKPLVWGGDAAARSARLARRFAERGLVLFENCQWPYTLPAFARLHPGSLDRVPRSFAMFLEPAGRGAEMLADALPHPLSLLQRLAPADAPHLEDVRLTPQTGGEQLSLRFTYAAGCARVTTRIELRRSRRRPRETRLEIDGCSARRCVAPDDYALSFETDGRATPLDDPLTALVADFVACAAGGHDPEALRRTREIAARAAMLEVLVNASRQDGVS